MSTRFLLLWTAILLLGVTTPAQERTRAADTVEGTWRWKFVMPDGTVANPTLRLAFEDGKLIGTSSFRAGSETPITNAFFRNNEIQFQVIRDRDSEPIVTTYTGKWSGKTIKGSIESNWTGESQTYNWLAEKVHGPTGTWTWTITVGERKVEARVTLKQAGSKLEGALAGRGRGARPTKIKNGSIDDDGQLSFEVETGTDENRRLSLYKGKLAGDTITGKVESTSRGVVRETDWLARRSN